jgi:lipopolysaccharide transport system ATP-binding protein
MKTINLNKVSKQYRKREFFFGKKDLFWVLKEVDFSIEKGEAVGIIGSNGAGKTTLMRLISGITYPTEGKINITGKVVPLITVEGALNFILSARENMFLLTTALGVTNRKRRKEIFKQIIEFSGIGEYLDMQITKLSQGMISRLAFSIAAHVPCDVLLIDEVLAVGDQNFQNKCFKKIRQFKEKGKTIIFISHNMDDIKGICERVIWLDKGRLVKDGKPEDVISLYLKSL